MRVYIALIMLDEVDWLAAFIALRVVGILVVFLRRKIIREGRDSH